MAARNEALLADWDVGSPLRAVAISHDGTYIASGSKDGYIRIWDTRLGALIIRSLVVHSRGVMSVAWSHDDTRVVSGSEDQTIRIWQAHTGTPIGEPLRGHTFGVQSVGFSPDDTFIISGSLDTTIRFWDAFTGAPLGEPIRGHTGLVASVSISLDSTLLVSSSYDDTIRLWNARTRDPIGKPLIGHNSDVNSVALSSDSARIVSGSDDYTVCIWDTLNGALLGEPLRGHTGLVWSVAFSPDNNFVVSGSADYTVRVWDARTGSPIGKPLKGHTDEVRSVAFVPDSNLIVSCSSDQTIRVWQVPQITPSFDTMTSNMSAQKLFGYLVKHECSDLSSSIDLTQCSLSATIAGRFSDVRKVKMRDGILVAVKCLRSQIILEGDQERTMYELRKWSKVQHENVMEPLGIVMFQGQIGMVSLWMTNGTLDQYIQNNPNIDRYSLCVQVAKGVSYLHGIEVIHGDIRLSNVLVSTDGVAKINEFDYSILSEGTSKFSRTNQLSMGTLRWMAPELLQEQVEDGPPVVRNKSTDVYALGMTMLEIFTGRVPYHEFNYEMAIYGALYRKQLPRRPKELPEENKKTSRMWELLVQCWDQDPSSRLDAEDIAPALQTSHMIEYDPSDRVIPVEEWREAATYSAYEGQEENVKGSRPESRGGSPGPLERPSRWWRCIGEPKMLATATHLNYTKRSHELSCDGAIPTGGRLTRVSRITWPGDEDQENEGVVWSCQDFVEGGYDDVCNAPLVGPKSI
ncbi:WD40 repeat-like protein [Ceratobasidium sp. AG-I]|nr:WD40 repeat-like protein [Ceratobasidium sp. AG-I]